MKKLIFLLTVFTMALFTGCAKTKASAPVASSPEVQPEQASAPLDPEIEKLNRVLMSMSDRCKQAIPNGDPQEFLADLHKVLEIEKAFPADDLSLYYLIDKKHTVSA